MGRRALGAELTWTMLGRELRDGRSGREGKDMIAVAREQIERETAPPRGWRHVRHRNRYPWNQGNRRRTTSGPGHEHCVPAP